MSLNAPLCAEHVMESDIAPDAPVPRQIDVFGFKLNPMDQSEFLDFVAWHVTHRKRTFVTNLNLHGMAMAYESPAMAKLMSRPETVVAVDGMSIILMSRVAGHKLTPRHRVTSLDYIDRMFQRSSALGWNIYYVGGRTDVLNKGLAYFRRRHPRLNIFGHHGYFDVTDWSPDSVQNRLLIDIAARKTDILIVGMGMPRQEEWIESVSEQVDPPVIITIGAMIEYFGGSLPMPPRWLGPIGLEWLFRFATAPRRLAYRYLVEPFVLLRRLIHHRPSIGASDADRSE